MWPYTDDKVLILGWLSVFSGVARVPTGSVTGSYCYRGVGLVLWGDLKVLIDSPEVNDGSDVWKNQNTWIIQSWKLYSSTGIHVLETVSGLVLHMFVNKKYPLSVNLIERMLDHQLEISRDTVGNELTTAIQLIAFLKKQISDSRRPKVHDCPEQTATGKDISNPFMAVMTCQKSYSSSTSYDSCSESGKWFSPPWI
ncbi:hypothetical protein Tco_1252917 [Tanacetum coccineum]